MPDEEYQNPWDSGGQMYEDWSANQWGGQEAVPTLQVPGGFNPNRIMTLTCPIAQADGVEVQASPAEVMAGVKALVSLGAPRLCITAMDDEGLGYETFRVPRNPEPPRDFPRIAAPASVTRLKVWCCGKEKQDSVGPTSLHYQVQPA